MNYRALAAILTGVGVGFALTAADEKPVPPSPVATPTTTLQPSGSTNAFPAGLPATGPGAAEDLRWSGANVALRSTPAKPVVAPSPWKLRTPLEKTASPGRTGFGGFFSSFVQLFNPMAPVEAGTSAQDIHWYDSQLHSIPLPRSLRDERTHEAQAVLVSIGR